MNKYFNLSAAMLAGLTCANAQGLFDIAPNDEAQESLPLRFNVSGSIGYDDNVAPLSGFTDSSAYVAGYVGGSVLSLTPQTTWDVSGRVGYQYYLDNVPGAQDDGSALANLNLSVDHRISDRLRVSSHNYVSYEREPDYNYGFAGAQQTGEYLFWNSDNSVGYRWTERLGTYTGITFQGVEYDDVSGQDRSTTTFYHQFRYQLNQQSIVTFDYRYGMTNGRSVADSDNQYFLLGLEQRFSPQTVGVFRAGVQVRDVDDNGASTTDPFVEAAFRTQINESLSGRAFLRYGIEDYLRTLGAATYDDSNTLRIGVEADYSISPRLALHMGVNYIMYNYENGRAGAPDVQEDLVNLYLGATFEIRENLYLNGSYNYDNYSSDLVGREYDRNRFNLGVQMNF